MKHNFPAALEAILKHEGGFVDHPKDPGGATNKGITIGTLRRLGIDVDGDGDSDIVDLKSLRHEHVARVYKLFYWDAVKADLLPSGVDYTVADFAVNSGPSRAAKHLQTALGVQADGDIGPKTLAAAEKANAVTLINTIKQTRLRFLQGLKTWGTFGKGWLRRVNEVHTMSLKMAQAPSPRHVQQPPPVVAQPLQTKPVVVNKAPKGDTQKPRLQEAIAQLDAGHVQQTSPALHKRGWLATLIAAIAALFGKK